MCTITINCCSNNCCTKTQNEKKRKPTGELLFFVFAFHAAITYGLINLSVWWDFYELFYWNGVLGLFNGMVLLMAWLGTSND